MKNLEMRTPTIDLKGREDSLHTRLTAWYERIQHILTEAGACDERVQGWSGPVEIRALRGEEDRPVQGILDDIDDALNDLEISVSRIARTLGAD